MNKFNNLQHYSFFTVPTGFIGYPTQIVKAAVLKKPIAALDYIDKYSAKITKQLFKPKTENGSVFVVGGGVYTTSIHYIKKHPNIIISEVFSYDFDHYIGKYEPVTAQVQENYVKTMSNLISDKLQNALITEYQQWDSYIYYSNLIFGFSRNPIVKEFIEHAADEQSHIITLSNMLVNSGIRPTMKRIGYQDAVDLSSILKVQLDLEERAVNLYQEIVKLIKDDSSPILINIHEILKTEDDHAKDLRLFLRYA